MSSPNEGGVAFCNSCSLVEDNMLIEGTLFFAGNEKRESHVQGASRCNAAKKGVVAPAFFKQQERERERERERHGRDTNRCNVHQKRGLHLPFFKTHKREREGERERQSKLEGRTCMATEKEREREREKGMGVVRAGAMQQRRGLHLSFFKTQEKEGVKSQQVAGAAKV